MIARSIRVCVCIDVCVCVCIGVAYDDTIVVHNDASTVRCVAAYNDTVVVHDDAAGIVGEHA